MKTCKICEEIKDENKFEKWRKTCMSCRRAVKNKIIYPVSVSEKACRSCHVIKPQNMFNIDSSRIGGLHSYCNECRANKNQKHYTKSPNKKKLQASNYYKSVRGTEEFKAQNRQRQKERESTDLFYKLKRRLRNRLYYALKNTQWKKNTKFSEYIGCDRDSLINHIESQFKGNMSWQNYGEWHIDHIIPLDSATTEDQLHKLCHYSNLQPMWGEENLKKGNKL